MFVYFSAALKCMHLGRKKTIFITSLENTSQYVTPLSFPFHAFIRCYIYKHNFIIKETVIIDLNFQVVVPF